MSIIKRKAGSEDIVKSILEFDAVPTEGSPNLVESGAVAKAIGNLGQPLQWKGPATVAQLNAGITGIQPGWTYTLTDAGTLTDGSIAVEKDDEVAWTADGEWFKLGGDSKVAVFECYYSQEDHGYEYPTFNELNAARLAGKLPVIVQINPVSLRTYYVATQMNAHQNDVKFRFVNAETGAMLKLEGPISDPVWSTGSANIPTIGRFLPPVPRDQYAVMSIGANSYAIDIDSTSSMGWLLTGLRAPSSGIVKAGDQFELRFNALPYIPNDFDIYFGLAKLTGIDNSTYKQSFDVISQKIAPRKLTGVTNSLVGASGEAPLIFTFSKDVSFEPDEYIYLMMGVKRTDLTVSPTTLIVCPCVAQADYNNPIQRVCMAHNCLQRDVNSTFADSTGILATTFEVGYGNMEDNFMIRVSWNNSFGFANFTSTSSSVEWSVLTSGTPALVELYLMKV